MRQWVQAGAAAAGFAILSVLPSTALAQSEGLTAMDLNQDGIVTREEAKRLTVGKFVVLDVNQDQILEIHEFAAENPAADIDQVAQAFVELDENADDLLDVQEFSRRSSGLFTILDVNQDGVITPPEMLEGERRLRAVLRFKQQQQAGTAPAPPQ